MKDRTARVVALRAKKWTYARIGKVLGLTRQRAQQLLRAAEQRQRAMSCRGCGVPLFRAGRGRLGCPDALCLDCLEKLPDAPFAQRLRAFRLAARLTKRELARRSGVAVKTLHHYEIGRFVPKPRLLAQLVEVLGPGLAQGLAPEREGPGAERENGFPLKGKLTEDRIARVVALRARGFSHSRIAKALGVTRQRIQQILEAIRKPQHRSVTCARCGEALFQCERGRPFKGHPLCLGCLEKMANLPFGQRLLAFRLAAFLTQEQLASLSGVTIRMIQHYESGQRVPKPNTLDQLVKVLGPGLAKGT